MAPQLPSIWHLLEDLGKYVSIFNLNPSYSMYGLFTYIWVVQGVNVGKYSMEHLGMFHSSIDFNLYDKKKRKKQPQIIKWIKNVLISFEPPHLCFSSWRSSGIDHGSFPSFPMTPLRAMAAIIRTVDPDMTPCFWQSHDPEFPMCT